MGVKYAHFHKLPELSLDALKDAALRRARQPLLPGRRALPAGCACRLLCGHVLGGVPACFAAGRGACEWSG